MDGDAAPAIDRPGHRPLYARQKGAPGIGSALLLRDYRAGL